MEHSDAEIQSERGSGVFDVGGATRLETSWSFVATAPLPKHMFIAKERAGEDPVRKPPKILSMISSQWFLFCLLYSPPSFLLQVTDSMLRNN